MTAQESVLCGWLIRLWQGFQALWHDSTLGGWFHRCRLKLETAGQESRAVDFFTRPGALRRGWAGSRAGRVFSAVLNWAVSGAKGLYRLGKGLFDGSVCFKGLTALGRGAWLLLGGLVLLMLVAPHNAWDNLYAFLGAAAVYVCFALGCADRDRRLEVGRMGPWFALYFLFITLGLALSFSAALSLRFYLFHLTGFLIVLVAVSAVDDIRQLRGILFCAALGLAAAALYGCYQGHVGVEVVASQQDLTLNEGMPGRIYSFFDNPNNFAEVLTMLIPLTAALTLNAKSWGGKLLGVGTLAVAVAAMGMTYSRSSWLGLVLALVIFLVLVNWRFLPAMVVVGLCAFRFLPKSILNRVGTIGNMQDSSARYRVAIWEDTRRLLRDHGLVGTGLGNDVMGRVFLHYPTLYDGNYPIHTHNNYLQMWGEVGIFGLLAFLGMIFGQVKEGLSSLRGMDKDLRRILGAALGSFVGISVIGLVEYTWFYPRNMFLYWFLFGVIAVCVKLSDKERA